MDVHTNTYILAFIGLKSAAEALIEVLSLPDIIFVFNRTEK